MCNNVFLLSYSTDLTNVRDHTSAVIPANSDCKLQHPLLQKKLLLLKIHAMMSFFYCLTQLCSAYGDWNLQKENGQFTLNMPRI